MNFKRASTNTKITETIMLNVKRFILKKIRFSFIVQLYCK